MVSYNIYTMADWSSVVPALFEGAGDLRVWCFRGNLGAGKTTLIKAICEHLGVRRAVTSPTFTLMHEYDTVSGEKVYHFDFYRVNGLDRVVDIGFESFLGVGAYVFIEWPEVVQSMLYEGYFDIHIGLLKGNERVLSACCKWMNDGSSSL